MQGDNLYETSKPFFRERYDFVSSKCRLLKFYRVCRALILYHTYLKISTIPFLLSVDVIENYKMRDKRWEAIKHVHRSDKALSLFVFEVLRPSQPNGVMSSAASLPNHTYTGQA